MDDEAEYINDTTVQFSQPLSISCFFLPSQVLNSKVEAEVESIWVFYKLLLRSSCTFSVN